MKRFMLPVLIGFALLLLSSTKGWRDGSKVDRLNTIEHNEVFLIGGLRAKEGGAWV